MIINDDILNWCKEYKGEKFHSLVCDPPYELNFMNKGWDNTGIAFKKETWEALKEHLYPGAFCFAFASTRGLHRMMVAIEDAGFVIHPTIFLYSFGSGFPKATRIDTQIQSKDEQEIKGMKLHTRDGDVSKQNWTKKNYTNKDSITNSKGENYEYEPTDPIAKRWIGHRYGLQALKPSCEPIICFQKRYEGKPVNCIVETGAGALNIDGGRIATNEYINTHTRNSKSIHFSQIMPCKEYQTEGQKKGRWPSNLIIDKECSERFPMTNGNGYRENAAKTYEGGGETYSKKFTAYREAGRGFDDVGSAARYFKNVEMKIDAADPVFYTSKVSKQERELGCSKIESSFENGIYGDGLGNLPKANGMRPTPVINRHPTLKSIDLTTYLATLLLPPLEYAPRRILVPFAGAGSEMIGCLKAGWEEIVGIELTAEYIPIIEARFEYYKKQIELEKSMQLFEPEIMESMHKTNKIEELFGAE